MCKIVNSDFISETVRERNTVCPLGASLRVGINLTTALNDARFNKVRVSENRK